MPKICNIEIKTDFKKHLDRQSRSEIEIFCIENLKQEKI